LQENKFGKGVELEGAELQPFYPNLQGELYKSVGVSSNSDANKIGKDLLTSYVQAIATVMAIAAPVEELFLGGIGLIAKEVGLISKIESGVVKAAAAEAKIETANTKSADFVVTENGTAVPISQSRMKEGFEKAGFQKKEATQTSEKGRIYTVPTKNGKVDVSN
jgi:hypothetical protein